MTKKQSRDIARLWVGSSARNFWPDLDPETLSEKDSDKITRACIELGEKLLKNDPSFDTLEKILEYVTR